MSWPQVILATFVLMVSKAVWIKQLSFSAPGISRAGWRKSCNGGAVTVLNFRILTLVLLPADALTYSLGFSFVLKPKWLFVHFCHSQSLTFCPTLDFSIAYFTTYFTEDISGHQPTTQGSVIFLCACILLISDLLSSSQRKWGPLF